MGQRTTKDNLNYVYNMYQTYPGASQGRKNGNQYGLPTNYSTNQYNGYCGYDHFMNNQFYHSPPQFLPAIYGNQAPFYNLNGHSSGQLTNYPYHYQMPVAPNPYFCFNNLNLQTFTW